MAEHGGVDTFLAGFFIGGVIGAGVALLFAPATGRETREYIKRQVGHAFEESKEGVEKLRQIIREEIVKLAESKEALKEAFQAGVETFKAHGKAEGEGS